jgi:hypothetical protein
MKLLDRTEIENLVNSFNEIKPNLIDCLHTMLDTYIQSSPTNFRPSNLIDEENFLEVRLRYFEENWEIYFGDISFDTDHRGYWGYSYLTPFTTPVGIEMILDEMFMEVEDSLYM